MAKREKVYSNAPIRAFKKKDKKGKWVTEIQKHGTIEKIKTDDKSIPKERKSLLHKPNPLDANEVKIGRPKRR